MFSYSFITFGPRITISPGVPAATGFPFESTTRTSGPAARPTVPGLRVPGGKGLLAIWCAASVIPYASITGAPNTRSSSAITVGGSGDDDERMNRSRCDRTTSALCGARSRIAWCIVGTPVYHVGRTSPIQAKNLSALNPLEHDTSPPAESGARRAAIEAVDVEQRHDHEAAVVRRERERGADVRRRRADVLLRERHDLGARRRPRRVQHERDVVARRTARRVARGALDALDANTRSKLPAPRSGRGANRAIGTPRRVATSTAADSLPCAMTRSFARRSVR